jgi:hypothetical protein
MDNQGIFFDHVDRFQYLIHFARLEISRASRSRSDTDSLQRVRKDLGSGVARLSDLSFQFSELSTVTDRSSADFEV